ncbi:MAG: PulJ/GspJ family protein [Gemmataceae bacterium]
MRVAKRVRRGFTLVEVLVAAALCIVIMTILTYAFQSGMDTLSYLKSAGDLQERLRSAEIILKRDLTTIGLEGDDPRATRVSDVRKDAGGPRPKAGFFRIEWHANGTNEGRDQDNLRSTRAKDHALRMSCKLPGRRADELFTTALPTGLTLGTNNRSGMTANATGNFASEWADVYYFLGTNSTGTTAGGTPTYTLYRQVRVVLPNQRTAAVAPGTNTDRLLAVAYVTTPTATVLDAYDLATPTAATIRGATGRTAWKDSSGNLLGTDVLLTNVISFDVKAIWSNGTNVLGTNSTTSENPFFEPVVLSASPAPSDVIYDTAAPIGTAPVSTIRIKAIQIKLRIYDTKNKLSRQITLVQDL